MDDEKISEDEEISEESNDEENAAEVREEDNSATEPKKNENAAEEKIIARPTTTKFEFNDYGRDYEVFQRLLKVLFYL